MILILHGIKSNGEGCLILQCIATKKQLQDQSFFKDIAGQIIFFEE